MSVLKRRTPAEFNDAMRALLEGVVAEITYLDGWRFTVAGGGAEPPRVALRVDTVDADTRQPMVAQWVAEFRPLPEADAWTPGLVALAIWRLVMRAHRHEAGEFFTWRGERLADPHRSKLTDDSAYLDARLVLTG
jgi:hypothetical protein